MNVGPRLRRPSLRSFAISVRAADLIALSSTCQVDGLEAQGLGHVQLPEIHVEHQDPKIGSMANGHGPRAYDRGFGGSVFEGIFTFRSLTSRRMILMQKE